jgi:hypothetical protein
MTSRATAWNIIASLLLCGTLAMASPTVWAQNTSSEPMTAADTSAAAELALWNKIKESTNSEDFRDYLNKFPNGMFFDPAKQRYEELTGKTFEPSMDAAKDQAEEPDSAISAAPPPPPEPVKVKKTVKIKAKATTKRQTRKVAKAKKPKLVSAKPKKKPVKVANKTTAKKKAVKKTRVAKLPAAKTKKAVKVPTTAARKPRQCPAGASATGECLTVAKQKSIIPVRSGGNGGSGGGSGASGGGWGG